MGNERMRIVSAQFCFLQRRCCRTLGGGVLSLHSFALCLHDSEPFVSADRLCELDRVAKAVPNQKNPTHRDRDTVKETP